MPMRAEVVPIPLCPAMAAHSKPSVNGLNENVDKWREGGDVLFTRIMKGLHTLEIQPLEMAAKSSARHTPGSLFISLSIWMQHLKQKWNPILHAVLFPVFPI